MFDNNGDMSPSNTHGTHVAGIAIAKHNNVGIAGVAPNSKLIPIKVNIFLSSNSEEQAPGYAKAINYAIDRGADNV